MITEQQAELIKANWGILIAYCNKVHDVFYPLFFEIVPEAKALFKEDEASQTKKLLNAITLIISKLGKKNQLHEELKGLAKRHIQYGVKVEYFKGFEIALLETFATIYADKWTLELKEAWVNLLGLVIQAMKDDMQSNQRMTMDFKQ